MNYNNSNRTIHKAFTLVELLVVVAIISILSLIIINTVSNAKVKAEISKVQSDFHQIANAIDSFELDHQKIPYFYKILQFQSRYIQSMNELTTPISYISSLPVSPWYGKNLHIRNWMDDPLQDRITTRTGKNPVDDWTNTPDYLYSKINPFQPSSGNDWLLISYGPTRVSSHKSYSATNGIVSIGSIYLTSHRSSSFSK